MPASWQASVQTVIEEIMRARAVPGVVIAVARGEGRPECLAMGSDRAGRPLAEDSLLRVASITTRATALAVPRLADRGASGLDDPLARHVPEAAARGGGAAHAPQPHRGPAANRRYPPTRPPAGQK